MNIGDRIKQIRGDRSRAEFANVLSIHPQTLYLYEKGKRVVDVDLVQQICEKFNVSAEWLIFGEDKLAADQEQPNSELVTKLAEQEAMLAKKDAYISQMKNELISAQAEALKAYEVAFKNLYPAENNLSAKEPVNPIKQLSEIPDPAETPNNEGE